MGRGKAVGETFLALAAIIALLVILFGSGTNTIRPIVDDYSLWRAAGNAAIFAIALYTFPKAWRWYKPTFDKMEEADENAPRNPFWDAYEEVKNDRQG